jgi:hypothetical protein
LLPHDKELYVPGKANFPQQKLAVLQSGFSSYTLPDPDPDLKSGLNRFPVLVSRLPNLLPEIGSRQINSEPKIMEWLSAFQFVSMIK